MEGLAGVCQHPVIAGDTTQACPSDTLNRAWLARITDTEFPTLDVLPMVLRSSDFNPPISWVCTVMVRWLAMTPAIFCPLSLFDFTSPIND